MVQASSLALEPVLPGFRPLSPRVCYWAAGAVLLGLWVGYYLLDPFGFDKPNRDAWHHVAVLRELMAAPFNPSNPHIPTDEPSRYFTPVNVLAALVGKLLGLSPFRLFGFMGAATCVGLIIGCRMFAQRYYRSPWAPLALLLTLLFAWGGQMAHVGLHTYATLISSAAYPSIITLVLGLFSWALVLRMLESDRPRAGELVLHTALAAVILLTHQLSGVIMLAGTGSLALFHRHAGKRSQALVVGALALGGLATLAWPYFNVLDVLTSVSDARWRSPLEEINRPSVLLVLLAPSVVGVLGFRRPEGGVRWELLLPAAFFTVGYVVLALQGSAIAHRFVPAIVLFNQLGLVWLVLAYFEKAGRGSPKMALVAILVVMAGLAAWAGAKRLQDLQRRAAEGSLQEMAAAMASSIPPGSVSFATENVVFPLQSTGRRVVSIPRPEPVAPSLIERQIATDRFFAAGTNQAERRRLLERWDATHVVFAARDLDAGVQSELRELGASKSFSHGVEVVSIERSAAAGTEQAR